MSTKTKKKPLQPEIRNAVDYKSIYTNFAQTSASPADISIVVGEAAPSNTGAAVVEMKVRLVMAPLQAKIMLGLLAHAVGQYESQFGKIDIPQMVASQLSFPVGERELTEGD